MCNKYGHGFEVDVMLMFESKKSEWRGRKEEGKAVQVPSLSSLPGRFSLLKKKTQSRAAPDQ